MKNEDCIKKNNRRTRIWAHVRDALIVIAIGNFISFLFNQSYTDLWYRLGMNSLYSLMIGMTLWKGNEFIGTQVSKRIDYDKQPFRALKWNLIMMFSFSLVAIIVVNFIWFVLIWDWSVKAMFSNGYITMVIEFGITIIITSIFFAIGFFRAWRESAVREERLQKESIKLQYNALKNQVNPHFLFNSLNTLTSLVYEDADQSARYIKQLSEVYRYVLEHKDTELVSLDTELDFCTKYVYLQKIRHGDDLQVEIGVDKSSGIQVVPMSVQLLIENAIKHNEISEDNPLTVKITLNDAFIIVRNPLQPRSAIPDKGGIGLETLEGRYAHLSDQPLQVLDEDGYFTVMIPILK
ncbi:MAG: histidine kinase [Bacteroidales bacterium]|nr:histidine kinase [Bacteroidales bacterium]